MWKAIAVGTIWIGLLAVMGIGVLDPGWQMVRVERAAEGEGWRYCLLPAIPA